MAKLYFHLGYKTLKDIEFIAWYNKELNNIY